jgi:predicted ATPase/DNA-binding CsgD family transcriptional regulator/DNA-binding XRE family transcriptional regulator
VETRETPQPLRGSLASGAARFGPLLRACRLAAGLTLQELAQRTGLSRRAISALELGYRKAPHTRTIERLANALGLDPEMRAEFTAASRGALILLPRPQPSIVPVDATLPAATPDMPEQPQHNLPLPPTPLLGRERDLAELTVLLKRKETRLITLTGSGGVGKTRLALEVAWALQRAGDSFPDGVWLVRLAPLTDPTMVLSTIAQTLGLNENGGASIADLLRSFLHDKSLLLLLDNFEQVAAAATQIAELLESSAGLRALVTSRAPLRLRGEHIYPVALLAVPPNGHGRISAEQLDHYAATALFLQRACAVRPDFPVTDASAPLIADICARLDGLPLSIELAATWARLLSPTAMLAQLEHRLPLLTAGAADLPARQRTMRAAIAWSYDLLDAGSRSLFGRLAVFVDGWTLDAAKVVCQIPSGAAPLRLDTLTELGVLLDQSLIAQRMSEDWVTETPRFEMLHIVREFALEQLEASGEAEAVRRAHARYVLAFAEEAEPELRGPDDITWMKRVERELGNVRAALQWARAAGEAELGLRLATALWRFWTEAGYLSEGQQWIESLLALAPPETASIPTWLRARALTISGAVAAALRQIGPALAALDAGLRLARVADDWLAQVIGLLLLGLAADLQGEPRQAEACYEEALAVARARGDTLAVFTALGSLAGLACTEQRWAEATARFTDALNVARTAGRRHYEAAFLVQLGEVALWQGEAPRAALHLGEALAVAREANWAIGWRRWDAIVALDLLAVACAQRGQQERGARLLGASALLWETLRQPYAAMDQLRREPLVAPIRATLCAEPWDAAFAAGQQLTLEETFAEALVDASALAGGDDRRPADERAPTTDRSAARIGAEYLTRRELEVLRLLAEGLTDAQIAHRLVVSLRTANHHVASLYSKLGVTSRAAATRFALERSLL